jgi:hypothetical protein
MSSINKKELLTQYKIKIYKALDEGKMAALTLYTMVKLSSGTGMRQTSPAFACG